MMRFEAPTRWMRSVILNAAAARLVFLAPYILTRSLAPSGFANGADRALPLAKTVLAMLGDSARSYVDFSWYALIAKGGYAVETYAPGRQSTIAFFPLQPLLMRIVDGPPILEFLISNLAFMLSAGLVYAALSRTAPRPVAHRATLCLVHFPFSFCMAQFRPESWLLLLGALATLLSLQRRPWLAAAAGALTGLTKPNAFLLATLTGRGLLPARWQGAPAQTARLSPPTLLAATAPLLGLGVMMVMGAIHGGDPLAFAEAQQA